ncbi:MAG TPA: ISAs1 family transposase, partial [Longimicrobiaceae bacterium]|nr:ISAs1 family transposase [Longimicrobiaceae bacterium]
MRDVTFGEDASQIRTGSVPELLAALRTTTIGLLRAAGHTNLVAAGRYYAAPPWAALALLGVTPE